MGLTAPKLPAGYRVGMRVRTNAVYHRCYLRSPRNRYGTIVGGSRGNEGDLMVKLDDHKYPKGMDHRMVDIVGDSKAEGE